MKELNSDLTTTTMIETAHDVLMKFIKNNEYLDEYLTNACICQMEELLEKYLLDFGVGWIASENEIFQIKAVNFQNKQIEYSQSMIFDYFIEEILPVLKKITEPQLLIKLLLSMKSQKSLENRISKYILYKIYFGLELLQAMLFIYSSIPEIQFHIDEYTYMAESLMFNSWWNEIVNQEKIVAYFLQTDGNKKKAVINIKPIITVNPDGIFKISNCSIMLTDYNSYYREE